MPDAIAQKFQDLFDRAVANDVFPGAQFVVFDEENILINGVSGHAMLPSENDPHGSLMQKDTPHCIASCTKISVSLLCLMMLERGLGNSGMRLDDLDDYEKLIKVLPEFKLGSGNWVTKIIEGFEPELGADGKKVPILRDAKTEVTLRMLLTHTTGLAYMVSNRSVFQSPANSIRSCFVDSLTMS
jgi:CubicO group peptidase (beta-lactamase class C family)